MRVFLIILISLSCSFTACNKNKPVRFVNDPDLRIEQGFIETNCSNYEELGKGLCLLFDYPFISNTDVKTLGDLSQYFPLSNLTFYTAFYVGEGRELPENPEYKIAIQANNDSVPVITSDHYTFTIDVLENYLSIKNVLPTGSDFDDSEFWKFQEIKIKRKGGNKDCSMVLVDDLDFKIKQQYPYINPYHDYEKLGPLFQNTYIDDPQIKTVKDLYKYYPLVDHELSDFEAPHYTKKLYYKVAVIQNALKIPVVADQDGQIYGFEITLNGTYMLALNTRIVQYENGKKKFVYPTFGAEKKE